jgi:hypothetical protein
MNNFIFLDNYKIEMSEIRQNLKKLYKIFQSTEFPFYSKESIIKRNNNKKIFLQNNNYKPITKESLLKDNNPFKKIYYISRIYNYEKYEPERKLKSGLIKIKSLDKTHPDYKIIEKHREKLKSSINNNRNLYKVRTKITGSELVENNKVNNNLLNLLNDKDDFEYKILFQKFSQKNNKSLLFAKYKNAQTNTYHSLTERRSNFNKIPPIKNKFIQKYFKL